jgi:hypothetical protein
MARGVDSNLNLNLVAEMRNTTYWDSPFTSLCDSKELTEFYVIDVQLENRKAGRVTFLIEFSV